MSFPTVYDKVSFGQYLALIFWSKVKRLKLWCVQKICFALFLKKCQDFRKIFQVNSVGLFFSFPNHFLPARYDNLGRSYALANVRVQTLGPPRCRPPHGPVVAVVHVLFHKNGEFCERCAKICTDVIKGIMNDSVQKILEVIGPFGQNRSIRTH